MRNSAAKKHNNFGHTANDNSGDGSGGDVVESWADVAKRHILISRQAEEACHLEGNNNSPDFDLFEQQYGLSCFA